jgi:hypothetical protein
MALLRMEEAQVQWTHWYSGFIGTVHGVWCMGYSGRIGMVCLLVRCMGYGA